MRIDNPHYPNVNALADQLSSLSFDSSSLLFSSGFNMPLHVLILDYST